ncbi:MAG: heme exporter protein CcmB [Pseudomonadales bacterium]
MTDSSPGLGAVIAGTVRRELLLAVRSPGEVINPLMFFVIAVTLFPLGGGVESNFLSSIASGVIWVTALLAIMFSMDSLFRADYEDGSLEQLLMSHWLVACLPIIILAPVFADMLAMPDAGKLPLMLGLLVGTPVLCLLGAIGMALTVGLSRSGLLLAVLILPLYIPVLVFGTGMVEAAMGSLPYSGLLALLGAILIVTICLSPLAIGAALRISVN